MHTRLWIAAAVAATPILALSPVAFPATHEAGCVRPAPGARYNQRLFTSLMRRRDAIAERTLAVYNVMRVKSRDVKPVSDPALCARAAIAYGRALHAESPDRKVHILRVGDRYVVMDPDYRPDDYHRAVTFDSTFTRPLALVAE
ncbi:MAG: hypothetical protein Q7S20_08590 [Gemmatimonadaceae bacterium]|nr:hypothetical protein [Gemmatimonadaceae bacterium]